MCPLLSLHTLFFPPYLMGNYSQRTMLSESIQLGWSAATGTGIACSVSYHSGNLSPEHQITHCKCCKVMIRSGSWEDHSDLLWLVAHILSLSSWLTTASHCWISRLPVSNRPGDLVPPSARPMIMSREWKKSDTSSETSLLCHKYHQQLKALHHCCSTREKTQKCK